MKRLIPTLIIICAAAAVSVKAPAQVPADTVVETVMAISPCDEVSEAFVRLHSEALDLLPSELREAMVEERAASDTVAEFTNLFGEKSKLLTLTPDYLKAELTPSSHFQLKMLRDRKKRPVFMAVYTVGNDSQAGDSDVRFYDEELTLIPADKLFPQPDLSRFFEIPKGSLTSLRELREMIPFPTYEYTAAPGSDTVEVKLTATEYLGSDERHIAELFLVPTARYRWNGSKFIPEKKSK